MTEATKKKSEKDLSMSGQRDESQIMKYLVGVPESLSGKKKQPVADTSQGSENPKDIPTDQD
ncbi:MAG: hypothetical protein AABX23_04815 [Nanoarchaeota archaeon]